MSRKEVVSFGIDQETLKAIEADISEARAAGEELDFSKWMRDAARRKLRRQHTAEKPGRYGKKKK